MAVDFYQILGVNKGASKDELKQAYRKLAKQYHPDKNPGDAEAEKKFKEVSAAYDILKDEERRSAYDQYGAAAFDGSMGGGGSRAGAGGFDFSNFAGGSFSDIFEDLFSGGRGGGRQRGADLRGSDLRYNLDISLEDAFTGSSKEIKINTNVGCEKCDGSGSADKGGAVSCDQCGGAGKVRMQQGFFTIERGCSHCHGTGKSIKNPCGKCSGTGRHNKHKTLSVSIPQGVEDGMRIRLTGEGEAGMLGSASGDLYIFVTLKPHKFFQREGHDLHASVPVPMALAALGGDIEVPIIDGTKAKLSIPAGTQTGNQLRLKGKGMTAVHGSGRGDMYVHIAVETPVKLNKKQKELLEEFAESSMGTSPKYEGFLSKLKDFIDSFKG